MTVNIETERLVLRNIEISDAKRINKLCNAGYLSPFTTRALERVYAEVQLRNAHHILEFAQHLSLLFCPSGGSSSLSP